MRWHTNALILCLSASLLILVPACATDFKDVEIVGVPVVVVDPNTELVDADLAFDVAEKKVQEITPGAYFQGMGFSGKAQDLPQLRGKLIFIFARVDFSIPKQHALTATATVNTINQTMSVSTMSFHENYYSTKRGTFPGARSIRELADTAYRRISEVRPSPRDVTITQLDKSWNVRCGPLENFIQECLFEIVDGEIKELER